MNFTTFIASFFNRFPHFELNTSENELFNILRRKIHCTYNAYVHWNFLNS